MPGDDNKKQEGDGAKIEISVSLYRSLILDRLRAQIAAKQAVAQEQIAAKQKAFEQAQSLDHRRLVELFESPEMPYWEMPHWEMPHWEMPHWSSVGS